MAKPGARPRGSRGPAPLLLAGLALLGAVRARAAAGGSFSLHPPYFNLAEGARIAASATCGEEAPARGAPRPTEDLYCKLVGGAGGDPNQTIQVSAGRGSGGAGRAGPGRGGGAAGAGHAPGSDSGTPARLGEEPQGPRRSQVRTAAPAARLYAPVPPFGGRKGPQLGPSGSAREVRVPPGRRHAADPGAAGTARVRRRWLAGGERPVPGPRRPQVPGSRRGRDLASPAGCL
ncbi:hypothetical protein J1605_012964 [Eschrichtius robustus]|uniref:Uncharacterized protein n=1 Tax=Eschrichtius robustus TaxID=9764 RepID=A0AB34GIL3_ESCRO|nr:hypothetical protein J1605_012964 [Eschrichtius robustus]